MAEVTTGGGPSDDEADATECSTTGSLVRLRSMGGSSASGLMIYPSSDNSSLAGRLAPADDEGTFANDGGIDPSGSITNPSSGPHKRDHGGCFSEREQG